MLIGSQLTETEVPTELNKKATYGLEWVLRIRGDVDSMDEIFVRV